jgi:peroxiredoxin
MNTRFLLMCIPLIAGALLNCAEKKKEVAIPEVNDLPVLTVTKTDGSEIFIRGLAGKTILIFFNPDCDHCQNEAKAIVDNKRSFEEYQLYFISSDSVKNIEKFADDYQLTEPNYHLARAEGMAVYNAVGPLSSVPAIFIYNDRKKVKEFLGETKIEEIKKFL